MNDRLVSGFAENLVSVLSGECAFAAHSVNDGDREITVVICDRGEMPSDQRDALNTAISLCDQPTED